MPKKNKPPVDFNHKSKELGTGLTIDQFIKQLKLLKPDRNTRMVISAIKNEKPLEAVGLWREGNILYLR